MDHGLSHTLRKKTEFKSRPLASESRGVITVLHSISLINAFPSGGDWGDGRMPEPGRWGAREDLMLGGHIQNLGQQQLSASQKVTVMVETGP